MCDAISALPQRMGNGVLYLIDSAKESIIESCQYVGRKIQSFKTDALPNLIKEAQDLALYTLKNYYFVMPGVAFGLGYFADAAIASVVCGVSLLDWGAKDKEIRESFSIFFGVPLALHFSARVVRFIAAPDAEGAISLVFQAIALAKLALIGRGENY